MQDLKINHFDKVYHLTIFNLEMKHKDRTLKLKHYNTELELSNFFSSYPISQWKKPPLEVVIALSIHEINKYLSFNVMYS